MKVNDIVKIKPEFCDVGESEFTYIVVQLDKASAQIIDVDGWKPFIIQRYMIEGESE